MFGILFDAISGIHFWNLHHLEQFSGAIDTLYHGQEVKLTPSDLLDDRYLLCRTCSPGREVDRAAIIDLVIDLQGIVLSVES